MLSLPRTFLYFLAVSTLSLHHLLFTFLFTFTNAEEWHPGDKTPAPVTCPPDLPADKQPPGCATADGEHVLHIPVPADLLEYELLLPITEKWIRKHPEANEVPFERGAWLWGDYKNELDGVDDIDGCMKECEKDKECGHWAFQPEMNRCDLHKHEGSLNQDVANWVVGYMHKAGWGRHGIINHELEEAEHRRVLEEKRKIEAERGVLGKVVDGVRAVKERVVGGGSNNKEGETGKGKGVDADGVRRMEGESMSEQAAREALEERIKMAEEIEAVSNGKGNLNYKGVGSQAGMYEL